jgi:chromosome segregation ATPase
MPYLQNEKSRVQAEIQKLESEAASLTTQIDVQQQAVASAKTKVDDARSKLAGLQAQRPALAAAATSAGQKVDGINQQIQEHEQNEPEKSIERPNKPPLPNPEWTTWNKRMEQLTEQRSRAEADAVAASTRLNNLDQSISQATAELRTAESQSNQAAAVFDQLKNSLSVTNNKLQAARQNLNDLTRFTDEIDKDPMNRPALEQAAAALSTRVLELEDAYAAARAVSRAADAALSSLTSRRDQLTAALADINSQLPAANEAVRVADQTVAELAQQIDEQISGGV